jgi:hypothetical protein
MQHEIKTRLDEFGEELREVEQTDPDEVDSDVASFGWSVPSIPWGAVATLTIICLFGAGLGVMVRHIYPVVMHNLAILGIQESSTASVPPVSEFYQPPLWGSVAMGVGMMLCISAIMVWEINRHKSEVSV